MKRSTATQTREHGTFDMLGEYGAEQFHAADPEAVRAEISRLLAPHAEASFEECQKFLAMMHPDAEEEELRRAWGWKIRAIAVARWVRERHVGDMDEGTLPSLLASLDRDGFNRLALDGALALKG